MKVVLQARCSDATLTLSEAAVPELPSRPSAVQSRQRHRNRPFQHSLASLPPADEGGSRLPMPQAGLDLLLNTVVDELVDGPAVG